MDANTTQLVADLGPEVLATLGGAPSSKLEQMKAKLQKRPPRKSRLAVFATLDDATAPRAQRPGGWPRRRGALRTSGRGKAMAGARRAVCAKGRGRRRAKRPRVEGLLRSFERRRVLLRRRLPAAEGHEKPRRWALVQEARRRSDRSERDFFVARATATFGDVERRQRIDHLFGNVPERHLLQIDEEGPTAPRMKSAPQNSRRRPELDGVACVVDATACVGGNSIAFARRFPRVVAVELNLERSRMLARNITHVRRFERLGRVDVVQGDCSEKLLTLDADWSPTLVFADPPWGGRHYEDCQDVDSEQGVHLKGKGTLDGFVETVAGLGCRRLLLKVPRDRSTRRGFRGTRPSRAATRAPSPTRCSSSRSRPVCR